MTFLTFGGIQSLLSIIIFYMPEKQNIAKDVNVAIPFEYVEKMLFSSDKEFKGFVESLRAQIMHTTQPDLNLLEDLINGLTDIEVVTRVYSFIRKADKDVAGIFDKHNVALNDVFANIRTKEIGEVMVVAPFITPALLLMGNPRASILEALTVLSLLVGQLAVAVKRVVYSDEIKDDEKIKIIFSRRVKKLEKLLGLIERQKNKLKA